MRLIGLLTLFSLLVQPALAQPLTYAEKVKVAGQVLERIGTAYGFDVLGLPKLVVYPKGKNNRQIAHLQMISAWLRQPDNSLYRSRLIMDEELIDICAAVDKKRADDSGTALAFVFSHEMAHFYHRHATFRSFADQKKAAMPETVSIEQESQADQTGLLFAYIAGYDPEPVLDALFDALYASYHLADKLWGYPAKADRQRKNRLQAAEFRTYGYLFAVGHALYCREEFGEAARCFEYVFTRYPLKEAYNNFGVCRLQQLVRLRKKDPVSYFALPFEVDPRNRLLRLGERGGTATTPEQDTWFKEADAAFGRAIGLDAAYKPAYLNQAMGALMASNAFLSLGILTTLAQKTGQPLPPNGHLIQAMAHGVAGDWVRADRGFAKAVGQRAYQAPYNRHVAQVIKQQKLATLRQPWQRLQAGQADRPLLGCRVGGLVLQEIDDAPADVAWPGTYLVELSNPRPFISVETKRAGMATYFRVKLGETMLYFARQPKPVRAGS